MLSVVATSLLMASGPVLAGTKSSKSDKLNRVRELIARIRRERGSKSGDSPIPDDSDMEMSDESEEMEEVLELSDDSGAEMSDDDEMSDEPKAPKQMDKEMSDETKAPKQMCEGEAKYTITYDMEWNSRTHPIEYPDTAMFTPFFTFAHSDELTLWRFGEKANEAVVLVAEDGDGSGMEQVAEECTAAGTCNNLYPIMCKPEVDTSRGVCEGSMDVTIIPDRPYVSSASMVFPSPDWFTGVDSINLCKDGKWVDSVEEYLFPLDAGSDFGPTFLSENLPSEPRQPITSFADVMPGTLGIFYNPTKNTVLPLGKLIIKRN